MPTVEECTNMKIAQAKTEARMEAISDRLDEVLREIQEAKKWAATYGSVGVFIILLGDKAIPIIMAILNIPA